MLLAADIGNTNITLALFDGDKYIKDFRITSDRNLSPIEYRNILFSLFKDYKVDSCIIGSVVDELNLKFKSAIDKVFKINSVIVSNSMDLGFSIKIDNPDELGADRIANAATATTEYDKAVIVVDFGTATSFDIINSNKEFLGGVIAPGIRTQLNSLSTATSKLPKCDPQHSNNTIGTNTIDAIMSGVLRGTAYMVDGIIEQCEMELDEQAVIIATGGNSSLVTCYCKRNFDKVDPHFTIKGLKYIYDRNKFNLKKEK